MPCLCKSERTRTAAILARLLRRWVLPPVLAVALLGCTATSEPRYSKDFNIRAVESSAPIPRAQIVDAISQVAKARGLKPRDANPPHWEGAFEGRGVFLTYSFLDGNEIGVGINIDPGKFGNGEKHRAEKLRDEIKRTLSLRFKGLEFVETHPKQ